MVDGKSVDTSMGFTPLAGLMMGTRCGDIDPALPSYLEKATGQSTQEVVTMMNKESGFLGISKASNDFRAVHELSEQGCEQAKLALKMFANRVIATIGSYAATLNGVDVITFTGGIGENSDYLRRTVCENLTYLGVELVADSAQKVGRISTEQSRVVVKVINTDEELMIARDSYRLAS
ncbi:hypothetical protein IC617_04370 [Neiella sp. HB171785]|uniref:Acetate kinase n=1 Tax=Neiella litorisoli TaxID=2771431 RepID=A0A8J6QPH9_9GAMM|nr:hypothetical protein [Neiella litorisoli]MBD1388656.1 hypothetical protein [Neiella litorisoli]